MTVLSGFDKDEEKAENTTSVCIMSGDAGVFLGGYEPDKLVILCLSQRQETLFFYKAHPYLVGSKISMIEDGFVNTTRNFFRIMKDKWKMTLRADNMVGFQLTKGNMTYVEKVSSLINLAAQTGFAYSSEFQFTNTRFVQDISLAISSAKSVSLFPKKTRIDRVVARRVVATVEIWGILSFCAVALIALVSLAALSLFSVRKFRVPTSWEQLSKQYHDDLNDLGTCGNPRELCEFALTSTNEGATLHFGDRRGEHPVSHQSGKELK